jgi:hypothetical protein
MVASFVSADGVANFTAGFLLSNIKVDTFVDDHRPLGAFAQTGPLPEPLPISHSFSIDSDLHTGTAQLFQLPGQNLNFDLEIDLMQLGDATANDFFFIDFPGSLVSAIIPAPTPEPGSLVLVVSALGGLAVMVRRKRRAQ